MRALIKADGSRRELTPPVSIESIRVLIGADTLDTVNLRHLGFPLQVMLVDDASYSKGLPVNEEATKLYHANCFTGTQHVIRGDVVVVPDDDFAAPDRGLPVDPNCAWPFPSMARAADWEGSAS